MENKNSDPVVSFGKTKISHDELKDVFYNQEQAGYLWRMTYLNAYYDEKYSLANFLAGGEKITLFKFLIDTLLNQFSLKNGDYPKLLNLILTYNNGFVEDIQSGENDIAIKTYDGTIRAYKLASVMPEVKRLFPQVDLDERMGGCHYYCIKFAENFNFDCEIATGYVAPLAKKNKNLHSWIELKLFGKDMVIDFTRGLLFEKEGYYMLKNIDEPVHKIDVLTLSKDIDKLSKLTSVDPFFMKLYFANRKEALAVYENLENKKLSQPKSY